MYKALSLSLFLGAALILAGCGEDDNWNTQDAIPIVVLDYPLFWVAYAIPQAELTVEEGEIRGDYLKLTVTYLGGCEEHEFGLFASTSILKSFPPIAEILLTHDASNDTCTGKKRMELFFDLAPFREYLQEGLVTSGTIFIPFEGLDEKLRYEF